VTQYQTTDKTYNNKYYFQYAQTFHCVYPCFVMFLIKFYHAKRLLSTMFPRIVVFFARIEGENAGENFAVFHTTF